MLAVQTISAGFWLYNVELVEHDELRNWEATSKVKKAGPHARWIFIGA